MATKTKRRVTKHRVSGTAAVGRPRRRSSTPARRRVSGTAAVGTTHKRRRRVSGTGAGGMMKQVIPMAVGMGVGVGIQHFALRPLEAKIAAHAPMAAKFFAVGEILLGGWIALKGKKPIVKGIGLGIMAGGVQAGVKQLNIYHESPSVQGVGDYTTVRIPVNGQVRDMLAGIIEDRNGNTYTSMVAGSEYMTREQQSRTNLLAGIYGLSGQWDDGTQDESVNYLMPKGI